MQGSAVFQDIAADCVQHKLFIHFFSCAIVKTPEAFILFAISKVSFCLDRPDLTFQNPFLTLNIRIGLFLQCFPPFVVLFITLFLSGFFSALYPQRHWDLCSQPLQSPQP